MHSGLQCGFDVVPVFIKHQIVCVCGYACRVPQFGVWFKSADDQFTGVTFDIDITVEVTQYGQWPGQVINGFGHQIKMFHSL